MKLTTLTIDGRERAAVGLPGGYLLTETMNGSFGKQWGESVDKILANGDIPSLQAFLREEGNKLDQLAPIPYGEAVYAPLLRTSKAVWGVGANFREKAAEMAVTPPDGEPICFLKPPTTLIGPGEPIRLPGLSDRVTAEAEIGIVIGRTCHRISEEEAMDAIAGFIPTLDMTAQDIHARNPRFLARAKAFDTFFSVGPYMLTPDECPAAEDWIIETRLNGETAYRTDVSCMIYSIPFIVAFFSSFMTLHPGDIIMSGTPGSVALKPGDIAECRIAGFDPLRNPVIAD
ncbi:fumarylacetoacetate hydrolase family protein [Paenibacillus sp. LHD-117]|uniref:fumarylacetoacetate hydrolase family protein n=1 Tax=Paenibacillus sp. LHD-117 TaxID=3071412 RepID=UPI0027DFBCF6|nr:fumarylacetoacetate hydrolase family protein [Paenibacillus sp. LHD-117]MDQ6421732.1 fumarylacetoacetate hydrolase family protein [Paenibacillus sp. LHD-117]